MKTARVWGWVAAVAVLAGPAAPAAPPTDDQVREQAVGLNDLTNNEAMQEKLTELLKDKAAAKRLVAAAAKLQKDSKGKEQPFKYNAALVLAKLAHNVKEYDPAEALYEFCADHAEKLQSGSKTVQSYDGLAELYAERKKYKEVEEVSKKVLDMSGTEAEAAYPVFFERYVLAKAKQGDTDGALKVVEDRADKAGDTAKWYFLQVKGSVQREAGKTDDALATYEDVLDKLDDSGLKDETKAQLKKTVRYLMTGLYVDGKKIDKAADILEKLMKDAPEDPKYYNDLGFIWADHDQKFEESEKLIRKALDLDVKQREKLLAEGKIDAAVAKKVNAAYLDSLGWVLFKQKKYEEAKKYLAEASLDDDEGQHLEIWDHLADAQLATGDKKGAVATWQKALKLEDVSRRDTDRRKKITAKLDKAKAE